MLATDRQTIFLPHSLSPSHHRLSLCHTPIHECTHSHTLTHTHYLSITHTYPHTRAHTHKPFLSVSTKHGQNKSAFSTNIHGVAIHIFILLLSRSNKQTMLTSWRRRSCSDHALWRRRERLCVFWSG